MRRRIYALFRFIAAGQSYTCDHRAFAAAPSWAVRGGEGVIIDRMQILGGKVRREINEIWYSTQRAELVPAMPIILQDSAKQLSASDWLNATSVTNAHGPLKRQRVKCKNAAAAEVAAAAAASGLVHLAMTSRSL